MKFRPLHDRVVIRRAESDTTSKGGIIIPDNAKEKPQEGEVIAVGPGARDESGALIALDVKAGDLILFGKWSGTEVKIDGEDLLIMKEADIMGIIDKSEMGIIDKSEMGIIDKSEMGIIEKTGAAKKAA
ncbi:co-chaperone GroES [Mesorhizobium sp.]|uniref:co-chaperone GroES n=1 Tax=Mesorhizobium sp. TaxID=1871066 RepID=UPI000FE385A2|nr:co-chaperone GroES [Mesorhizobium sp.]RWB01644.1 MAG: co-chaperone GroES [Mesorhizobium sp.]RWB94925.1 MAG: co-chaperone GroES [Mesorhizobium sp.]RWO19445.1 MAG: co-chaperone GroES [Mesorhizobium sp.]RWO45927.1 MAG: co-chaperone GroES [Mesorhizobium sp.]TIM06603.1 MAG: co-chaperone GroES [Mesorhizobium sp.]